MATVRFINLSKAINASLLKSTQNDAHDDYVKNYLAVCAYVSAVNKSGLPALLNPPAQWDAYQKNLILAKEASLEWVNTIAGRLGKLPDYIIEGNEVVLNLFNDGIAQSIDLITDPTDDYAKNKLQKDIEHSTREINDVIKMIGNVLVLLETYNNTLPEQAKNLQAIADLALQDEKADKAKITALLQDIKDMKDEISSLTAAIVGLAIADAAAITLSVVAVAAAGPLGLFACIFTGAIVGVATTFIALDGIKITALKNSIEEKQKSIDNYTADVATLQILSKTFSDLAQQSKVIEDNVRYILTVWQTLSGDLAKIKTELDSASTEYSDEKWASIKADFEEALTLWNTFIQQVNIYSLDNIQGNSAQLQLGMNMQDVENALNAEQNIDMITYLNKVG